MTSHKFLGLSRWSPIAVALLVILTFNLAGQAQDSFSGSSENKAPAHSIWKRVKTPNIGAANILISLSADSERDIWVVGDFVALHFDGEKWTDILPVVPPGEATLHGVAAVSPTDVWAVGSTVVNSVHLLSVIEHFDGKQWTIVASPQFASGSELFKVHAVAANDIYAVGDFNADKQQGQPLAEHYDGTKWSVVSTPRLKNGQAAVLTAITAISHRDLWVAGAGPQGGASGKPLVMHFDGHRFKQVPFPGNKVIVGGITAIAADDAWITGSDGRTLAAHWDGKAWTRVPTPDPSGGQGRFSELRGVSATSSTDVWAAGSTEDAKGFFNLVEHWDGKRWTISPIPSFHAFDELFDALAFPSRSVFVAGTTLHCDVSGCHGFDSVVFHTDKGK